MPRIAIGALADFPDGRGTDVEAAGRRIAVFRIGDRLFAIDDRCSHRGFPLNDGVLEGLTVRCRTHGACFDLATGDVVRGPARRPIRVYPAVVLNGLVLLDIP